MDKSFYILGLPIKVEDVGEAHFIKVKELPKFIPYQNILTINKDRIIQMYKEQNIDKNAIEYFINHISLYQWIINVPEFKELYSQLFNFIFKEDVFDKVNEDNFEFIRQLIMNMNCIKEEKQNPNSEIQKWIEKSKKFNENMAGKLDFQDIVSSVVVYMGVSYDVVNEMTLYQLYMTFRRINAFKDYDTTTLFATVSTEKMNIESWCKCIDLFENNDDEGMSRSKYEGLKGNIFGN